MKEEMKNMNERTVADTKSFIIVREMAQLGKMLAVLFSGMSLALGGMSLFDYTLKGVKKEGS